MRLSCACAMARQRFSLFVRPLIYPKFIIIKSINLANIIVITLFLIIYRLALKGKFSLPLFNLEIINGILR